ncbi:carbohydrate kinase [Pseudoduganella sp. RAF19]|uniref:carbohydrate kinase n=3 Tax=unclassified Pseudoduganella TaxID=2637179 RepID=UPI003F9C497E
MSELSRKEQLLDLIRANPFISQQELAEQLSMSRSAVAGHIATLIRERRLLGRAYVLPDRRPVLCIGAANLDRKLRPNQPLQMGTSNPATAEESFGGVARNIAENLARLALPCSMITALGDDSSGRALRSQAEESGIDMAGTLQLNGMGSGTYTAVLDARGELVVALADMALYDMLTPAVLSSRQPLRNAAAMVVADLNLPHDSIALLLAEARESGVPLVIVAVSQPKMARLPRDLRGLKLLILNRGELETRVGRSLPTEADVQEACREVRADGAEDVIVTCGAQGVYHTMPEGLHWLAAHDAKVVDVTGAGDAFSAAVCWSLVQESSDLHLACERGLLAAALTLESPHTVSPALSAEKLGAHTPLERD